MVPRVRFELTRLTAYVPKTYVATLTPPGQTLFYYWRDWKDSSFALETLIFKKLWPAHLDSNQDYKFRRIM